MNSLYQSMHQYQPMNLRDQFMMNPLGFIMQRRGVNIPSQFQNNPQGVIQYLMNNGQMTQQELNYVVQQAQSMGVQL